jgi:copper oxidase (laccase) domain-containing protein
VLFRSIDLVDADTCACEAEYFSNRRGFLRSDGDYGRNLSAIALVA